MEHVGLLYDARRCTGCTACVMACREADGDRHHDADMSTLSAEHLLAIRKEGDGFVRQSCMHCQEPACASVCPVGALRKQDDGSVTYDSTKCMGCRYCMVACPYSIPRYEWNSTSPYVRKCHLCHERRKKGETQTACASVCPSGALLFGSRDEMLAEGKRRIAGGGYVERVYGETEAGGTSVLIISDRPFESLGLPMNLPTDPLPQRTWAVISKIPPVISTMGVTMAGLWWIIQRREELHDESHS